MPSLTTGGSKDISTYKFSVSKTNKQFYHVITGRERFHFLTKNILFATVIMVVCSSVRFIQPLLFYQNNLFYESHLYIITQIYTFFEYVATYTIAFTLISIMFTFYRINTNKQNKFHFVFCLIFYGIVNGVFLMLWVNYDFYYSQNKHSVSYSLHQSANDYIFSKKLCHSIDSMPHVHSFSCTNFTLSLIYVNIVYCALMPLTHFITITMYESSLYLMKSKTRARLSRHSTINTTDTDVSNVVMNIDVDYGYNRLNSYNQANKLESSQFKMQRARIKLSLLYVVFFVEWTILVSGLYFLQNMVLDFEIWYYCFLVSTSSMKYIMKKIARKIDQKRVMLDLLNININYNNDLDQFHDDLLIFSFEWFVELLVSVIYWFIYYFWIYGSASTQDLNNLNHFFRFLVFTVMLHLFSEIFQTTLKISKLYFNLTNTFIQSAKNIPLVNLFVRNSNNISCNYLQWTVRNSIDIMIRFLASLVSGVFMLIYVATRGKHITYALEDTYEEYMLRLCIAFAADVLYFGLTLLINSKLHDNQCMIDIYCNIFSKHFRMWIISWICCVLLAKTMVQ